MPDLDNTEDQPPERPLLPFPGRWRSEPPADRTNDFNLGAEWTNSTSMLRVAYDGSWFDKGAP